MASASRWRYSRLSLDCIIEHALNLLKYFFTTESFDFATIVRIQPIVRFCNPKLI